MNDSEAVTKVLATIQDEARQADERAAEACARSKYSTQDYHLCIEFYLQQLHDRIAREHDLPNRCEIFPFRQRIAQLRRDVVRDGRPEEAK